MNVRICKCGRKVLHTRAREARISEALGRGCKVCCRLGKKFSAATCRRIAAARARHGFARVGKVHPLWRVRGTMLSRCYNPKARSFKNYGGRGIKVCRAWRLSSSSFIIWALSNGWKKGLEIHRENNDGNYSPANCVFITKAQNLQDRWPLSLTTTCSSHYS